MMSPHTISGLNYRKKVIKVQEIEKDNKDIKIYKEKIKVISISTIAY